MNQIPNNPMPITTQPDFHQAKLTSLNTLKEGRGNNGCKNDIANYLNWLYGKVNLYEGYTDAYNKVTMGSHIRSVDEYIRNANQDIARNRDAIRNDINQANNELSRIRLEIQRGEGQIDKLKEQNLLSEIGYYDYDHPADASVKLKQELDILKENIKEMQKNNRAINTANNFTFNNSAATGRKFTSDFSKLMLTAYNQEVENAIVKLEKTQALNVALARVEKAKDKVAKLGTLMQASISNEFHRLRVQEIELAFKYKALEAARKENEKEEKARIKEEERIQKEAADKVAQAERELREKRRALDALLSYEQQHLTNVVSNLQHDSPKVREMKAQILELEQAKKDATERAANIRTGYVYVISNIGSFGEGIVKIGLTRRLNPEDRVKELSSASVPFIFDTHAIHFSSDAVALERKLHQRFNDRRVNKMNLKKEYFRVTLDEVKQALVELSGDGATLRFTDEAVASDYRKSLEM